jgi:hypothetical protein
MTPLQRSVLAGALGAVVGSAVFVGMVRSRSEFTIEMDRRLPVFASLMTDSWLIYC